MLQRQGLKFWVVSLFSKESIPFSKFRKNLRSKGLIRSPREPKNGCFSDLSKYFSKSDKFFLYQKHFLFDAEKFLLRVKKTVSFLSEEYFSLISSGVKYIK